jgi:dTDP-4-dehydrorhamnose reductase
LAGSALDAPPGGSGLMRALLIGGSGQLGTEIRRCWTGWEILSPSHAELDLEDTPALEAAIAGAAPDAVVNCAAFHNVDRCEEEPDRAFAVNAVAVDRAARACRDRDVAFMTISTDYVFEGETSHPYTEADVPHPISTYGASKYAGELLVSRLQSRALVVRTCGVYGVKPSASKGHTFVDKIIALARNRQPVRIVDDVFASPTFAGDLAPALRELLERGATGLYHAVNGGAVSWYAFAREALDRAGLDWPIEAISSAQWKAGARRPRFSALDNEKLRGLGIEMPTWREGIGSYLELVGAMHDKGNA